MMTLVLIASYLLAYPLSVAASWLLLIALHEGGHALAALLLMPGEVQVYLGSYHQPEASYHHQFGRLHVFIKRKIWQWRGGCCYANKAAAVSRWRYCVFVLAGPLVPLLVASLGFYLGMRYENGMHRIFLLLFLFFAIVSALKNLFPSHNTIPLANGQLLGSDGFLLRQALFLPALTRQAEQAAASLAAGNYAESAKLYLALLRKTTPTCDLLRRTIHALLQTEQYPKALLLSRRQHLFTAELTDDDRFTHGLILSRLGQHLAAIDAYTALIEQPQPYLNAYNNRGYTYNLLGNYTLALADFNQVIAREPDQAYAYNNRGLALLKLGQEAAGLADIQHGLALDPTNAYGYRNLGIYYLDRGEYPAALQHFEQAQQLDATTHELSTYMAKTHQHLAQGASTGGLLP
ncbi:tetratricopeptide repeat protein [Hymenobacter sp. BT559]|uniref:tetratricopeptide repeat protein n=1 Tax=Hymenobacter sp. BT559 TaxID=2795729 RepID=UPI0018EAC3B5|nr:tetratricopeptide repeat protein [Hymenobacter sp. BT559]MBJ6144908.1 tetratricopeptide repeat protein [Hymenobacter sp. BT559]